MAGEGVGAEEVRVDDAERNGGPEGGVEAQLAKAAMEASEASSAVVKRADNHTRREPNGETQIMTGEHGQREHVQTYAGCAAATPGTEPSGYAA